MPHILLYFLALFALSTSSNLAKLNQMPVEVLGFYRLGTASLLLGLWLLFKKYKFSLNFNKNIIWALSSGIFFFLHLYTYKYAAKNTTIANTMIIFSSNPIWISLGAIIFFKEKLEKRLILAYLLALVGVYLLVGEDFKLTGITHVGDWSAIISAIFYAGYMLTSKKARNHFDNNIYAFIQYLTCALFFGFTVMATDRSLIGYQPLSWLSVLGLVALPTFLGHFSFTYLVNHMNISLMSCGKLIEPLFASVIAFFLFHEKMNVNTWLAFSLTSLSVLILFAPNLANFLIHKSKNLD